MDTEVQNTLRNVAIITASDSFQLSLLYVLLTYFLATENKTQIEIKLLPGNFTAIYPDYFKSQVHFFRLTEGKGFSFIEPYFTRPLILIYHGL